MTIGISPTKEEDIPAVQRLYDEAIEYQKKAGNNHWLGFANEIIRKEIKEERHFKILIDGTIGATFVITFEDPLIWKDWQNDPALYIHRIAVSHASRGNDLVKQIITWSKDVASLKHLHYLRMDTGSGNDRLINYYIRCGFSVVSTDTRVAWSNELPAHYKDGVFTLLQMAVN
jgi:Acetyltransferase (GNAT) family